MNKRTRQKEKILAYMRGGHWISPAEVYILCGSMKLATRISELIKEGYPIQKQRVNDNDGSHHMEYRLIDGCAD